MRPAHISLLTDELTTTARNRQTQAAPVSTSL